MNLSNAIMRPGRVIEVLGGGKIKASVPGLFNKQDSSVLPSIHQLVMGGSANTFSSPNVHDEIWVLNDPNTPEALFWFRKDKADDANAELGEEVTTSKNVEVICNRETSTGWATLLFSDGTGWLIKNEGVFMKLGKDGDIVISTGDPHRTISITDSCISLGTEGKSAHPATYGDKVEEALSLISTTFKTIRSMCQSNYVTMPISVAIGANPEKLDSIKTDIVSNNVFID